MLNFNRRRGHGICLPLKDGSNKGRDEMLAKPFAQDRHHSESGAVVSRDQLRRKLFKSIKSRALLFSRDRRQVSSANPCVQPYLTSDGKTVADRIDDSGMGTAADHSQSLLARVKKRNIVRNGIFNTAAIALTGKQSGITLLIVCLPRNLAAEPETGDYLRRLIRQNPLSAKPGQLRLGKRDSNIVLLAGDGQSCLEDLAVGVDRQRLGGVLQDTHQAADMIIVSVAEDNRVQA